jgi:hypothetical protein
MLGHELCIIRKWRKIPGIQQGSELLEITTAQKARQLLSMP